MPVQPLRLKGHQAPVLCVAKSPTHLLSGSEDRTTRLWDLRTQRAVACCTCPGDVTSVCFGRPDGSNSSCDASLSSPFSKPYSIYVGVEQQLFELDLRKIQSPVFACPRDEPLLTARDEINHVELAPQSAKLAVADDAGMVRVLSTATMATESFISASSSADVAVYLHNPQALVTSVAFAPFLTRKQKQYMVSAGTDCRVCLWEVTKNDQAVSEITIPTLSTNTNQVCNPPFVNSIAYSPSGKVLAAGLGDGSVGIFQHQSSSLTWSSRLEDAHSSSIASVLFPKWSRSSDHNKCANDRFLCSAGNDGLIALWDLGNVIADDKAQDPSSFLRLEKSEDDLSSQLSDLQLHSSPQTLLALNHGKKMNWLTSSSALDELLPSALFVADTSNEITVYTIL